MLAWYLSLLEEPSPTYAQSLRIPDPSLNQVSEISNLFNPNIPHTELLDLKVYLLRCYSSLPHQILDKEHQKLGGTRLIMLLPMDCQVG